MEWNTWYEYRNCYWCTKKKKNSNIWANSEFTNRDAVKKKISKNLGHSHPS